MKNWVAGRGLPALLLNMPELQRFCLLELLEELKGKNFPEMDVILQTPGGDPDAAFILLKILRNHAKIVNIIVPLYAKSAGTLLCLSADKIIVTELSELGPLDSQMPEQQEGGGQRHVSALNGFKALEQIETHAVHTLDLAAKLIKNRSGMRYSEAFELAAKFCGQTSGLLYGKLDPHKIGEFARALDVGKQYGLIVLTRFMGWTNERAQSVIKRLVEHYPSHGFVIDYEELKEIGLPAHLADENLTALIESLREMLLESEGSHIKLFEPESTPIET